MQIFLCLGKNRRSNLSVKSMQNGKIVVNIIFMVPELRKYDRRIYIYIYIYIYIHQEV